MIITNVFFYYYSLNPVHALHGGLFFQLMEGLMEGERKMHVGLRGDRSGSRGRSNGGCIKRHGVGLISNGAKYNSICSKTAIGLPLTQHRKSHTRTSILSDLLINNRRWKGSNVSRECCLLSNALDPKRFQHLP